MNGFLFECELWVVWVQVLPDGLEDCEVVALVGLLEFLGVLIVEIMVDVVEFGPVDLLMILNQIVDQVKTIISNGR